MLLPSDTRENLPSSLTVRTSPRRHVDDPTLGVAVTAHRQAEVAPHRLVTIGDSLTHGFMSGAVFRTDRSWPCLAAHELGLDGTFMYPVYEPDGGPGGLPFDLERAARGFQQRFGHKLDWNEFVSAALWLRQYMDAIEDCWERPATPFPVTAEPFHNLAVFGWDLLDVQMLNAARLNARVGVPRDNVVMQIVESAGDRAGLVVAQSCDSNGAGTVLDGARRLGSDGDGPFGIETLIVMLGANNALGAVVSLDPSWTPDDYLTRTPQERLASKGAFNVWQPPHFEAEWTTLVQELRSIGAQHVVIATVPAVTIAPIARGVQRKVRAGSRYFPYYTRPWIFDDQFEPDRDPCITEAEARAIDSAIDAYNETIIASVAAARHDGLDWYVFDLGGLLDRLAARRYHDDPSARPDWWTPYELPPLVAAIKPPLDTRFFNAGPQGRLQGGIISLDGVHPTTTGYALVAHEIVKLMDAAIGVPFVDHSGNARPRGTVGLDFERALSLDTLNSRPPTCISESLSLLGWLDQALDWITHAMPFSAR